MDGQLDLFATLADMPTRPFMVHAGRSELCSWCDQKAYLTGGGIHHDSNGKAWSYAFCDPCKERHGRLKPGQPITHKEGGP